MQFYIETERLILRDLLLSDEQGMFELDADPRVHNFLGNSPIKTMDEAHFYINLVQQQYKENGIGRWAVIEKSSGEFVGWSGLKFIKEFENNHTHFYDVGYRLIPKFWNKGYATESARAALHYGFETLQLLEIYGSANIENIKSRRALEKCGLRFVEKFMWKDIPCDWLKITRDEWKAYNQFHE